MSEIHHPGLAHHFETIDQQREATTLGMWLFLISEVMFFGGLFSVFIIYKSLYPAAFAAAATHLNVTIGAVNTVILVLSCLTMAIAVNSSQVGKRGMLVGFLILTILLGILFLGIKGYEYSIKFEDHLVPGANFNTALFKNLGPAAQHTQLFFSIYFAMTGMHALHMIVGVGILSVLVYRSLRGHYSPDYYAPVEFTGLYWDFVDIVWIFIFSVLYLIGSR